MNGATLLVDIGNSRVKWALAEAGAWLAEGACALAETAVLFADWNRFPTPARVMAANVAGDEPAASIAAYWQARGVPPVWAKAAAACAGVRNLYDVPEQLGSDRFAALVGAWGRRHGACLVVSAGTAVTIDALDGRGEFIGGLILPGRRLMQQSLAAGTHALEEVAGEVRDFPRNTADAMTSGIARALGAAVEASHRRLAARAKTPPACLMTGGDAEWLSRQVQIGAIIAPKLVLEGLLIMSREEVRA